jgi:hypothetical protein
MIHFSGTKLDKSDMKLLKEVAKFTLNKFLTRGVQSKMFVSVILDDNYESNAYGDCYHMGLIDGVRHFKVSINIDKVNRKAKKPFVRLKAIIETIIHEMIHVKQYAKGELFDYVNGDSRFQGKRHMEAKTLEDYYDAPYEIEAFGRTEGIFKMFIVHMREKN